ncbi:Membrane protein tms1 [Collariella sp. IMI 366227]|nr:Membrane protein tms1 [Collariella sp. IMI 366227]
MVAVYCSYLTMSAVSMEPDDTPDRHCNPMVFGQGTRTTTIVLGAIVTMLTVAYTTTRAATQSLGLGGSGRSGGAIRLPDSEAADYEHDMVVTAQPSARKAMRAEALRRAVEEGSLPADALLSDNDDDSNSDTAARTSAGADDERASTQYSYAMFHVIFFLATAWVATLLTMDWDDEQKGQDNFATVGRTLWASWVKIVSSWVCYAMYVWTLVAPVVLPERFEFE